MTVSHSPTHLLWQLLVEGLRPEQRGNVVPPAAQGHGLGTLDRSFLALPKPTPTNRSWFAVPFTTCAPSYAAQGYPFPPLKGPCDQRTVPARCGASCPDHFCTPPVLHL